MELPPSNRTCGLLGDELTGRAHAQAGVGMDGIAVLEPGGDLLQDGGGVRPGVHAGIVALQGFDERLADAVTLGAADWREAWREVQRGSEVDCLRGGVGGAVVGEPLDRLRGADGVEAALDAVEHHVTDHLAGDAAAGGGDPGDDLAVMGVDGKGAADGLAVPAGSFKAIGGPALIGGGRDDGALVGGGSAACRCGAEAALRRGA